MAQAIFKSWFVDFEPFDGEKPSDWREGVFSEIVASTLGGDWGKEHPVGNYQQVVYCIRGADLPEITLGNKGKMPVRYILPKNFTDRQLTDNNIVIEISGGSPTQSTGRCALITQSLLDRYEYDMVCTNFCRAIKPKEGYSEFIYYYWRYLYDHKVMFLYENGTTGIKNFDISSFLETEKIIIPTLNLVYKFSNIVKELRNTIATNGLEIEKLIVLRNTLLPKLLSGEISVSQATK
ncbi:Type I restriction-modification system, specificity subunit S [Streptococcus sp. DD11]|uniref:restriction endonuclease subunit S n=1 Tax=Streptococcus sp. DD11 TaxID=1777879 RepID=UPI0007953885|nr:restriction endonuclease subunit S [Streptococcus sp. DD11]KXT82388.1 Type I restriction-modification system, specificity subunit S [Streptococcus sp. DD11]